MEQARNSLIELLIRYNNHKNHEITVIFDAYKSGDKEEKISFIGGVKVIYTKLGETADDAIKKIITQERREWAVITSDKDISRHAWSVNSVPVPSDIFFDILQRRARSQELNDEDAEDIMAHKPVKGSSYRLSRKDRILKRVLGKL